MSSKNSLHIQVAQADIRPLAERYVDENEITALDAGQRIACGDHSLTNLETIYRWKTGGRGISRLRRNTDEDIHDALRLAVDAHTYRAAIAVLCGLWGIDIPVASAILTAIDPERYTIIDFRALEALGAKKSWHTIDSYLSYLEHCRSLARQCSISLRELDRALWQWSKEQSISKRQALRTS